MTQLPVHSDTLGPRQSTSSERDISHSPAIGDKSCNSSEHKHNNKILYENYILNNIQNLTNDECLTDVTFVVENEEFYGIRSLFGCQSIVFRQMLYGSMIESKPGNCVILNDVTIEAFKYLRNTFYNIFENELTALIVVDVLFAAKKYLIEPLTKKCLNFIKNINDIDDWYFVLHKFEESPFYISNDFIFEIINFSEPPYILQYKSLQFIQNQRFTFLKYETVIILISSDNLAVQEDDIWQQLLKWTRFNAKNTNKIINRNGDESKDLESENEREENRNEESEENEMKNEEEESIKLNESEKVLMNGFIKYIRFNQMTSSYLKENIVEKRVLLPRDIINIMFARENGIKWKSKFNDKPRIQQKAMDTFQLNEVCLTLKEIRSLTVGDLVDFRDFYGLFCSASIIDVDHNDNKIKIHYNSWGSTYDEWYNYLSADNNIDTDGRIILLQKDKNSRIAKFGSITNRKIKREYFRQKIEQFNDNTSNLNNECQVKLTNWFWKKNENYIVNKCLYVNKWLNAKVIGYKTAAKYSHHIKIGIYINEDHFEYWIHPDNEQEVRPIPPVSNYNNRYE